MLRIIQTERGSGVRKVRKVLEKQPLRAIGPSLSLLENGGRQAWKRLEMKAAGTGTD